MSEQLRAALHDLGDVPVPGDLADGALRRARRDRRRRSGVVAAAVAVAVAATATVMGLGRDVPAPTAASTTAVHLVAAYRTDKVTFWAPGQSRYVTLDTEAFLTLSPDGRRAAVSDVLDGGAPDRLGVVDLDRLATEGLDAVSWTPQPMALAGSGWSADGRRLLVKIGGTRSSRFGVLDATTLAVRPIPLQAPAGLFRPGTQIIWGRAGTDFLVAWPTAKGARTTELTAFRADGSAGQQFVVPASENLQLSPDGSRLLLMPIPTAGSDPMVYDLDSGATTTIRIRANGWYDDDHLYNESYPNDRTVVRVIDADTGEVIAERPVDGGAQGLRSFVQMVRVNGPAPAGAIVV